MIYLLIMARSRLLWFPLYSLGYIMAFTLPVCLFWFSIFLGWLCKTLISKYGGQSSARDATPLFLGPALGDVAMMLLWIAVDGLMGRTGHQLMPG